jgi:hypothetical protein
MNKLSFITNTLTRSSGGPSFFSASVYAAPILDISHRCTLLSLLALARTASWKGENLTLPTSSAWPFKVWNLFLRFLISQIAIVLSTEEVAIMFGLNNEKSIPSISAV